MRFLSGDEGDVEERLRDKMSRYAENEEFELALDCRNKLEMLSKIALRRITSLKRDLDTDVVAYTSNKLYAAVGILIIRGGIMQGARTYAVENASQDGEAVAPFWRNITRNSRSPTRSSCRNSARPN